MKYSFLMAINNDNNFVDDAIFSVLKQTDPDFNFFIVANNCSDELWNKLNNYKDPRIKLLRVKIGQLAYALNVGFDAISEGYALRIDSDDICFPDRLEKTKKLLVNGNFPDFLCGSAVLINEKNQQIGEVKIPETHTEIVNKIWRKNPIIHPACAIRVESVQKLRGYSGGFVSEDLDLWMRASRLSDYKFLGTTHPLIKYRIHGVQARGNSLAYAESAGYALREAMIQGKFKYFIGALFRILKFYVKKL